MHKFLFGNRRKNISSYNPFGSQKNMKPGIITKIKNKIQGLFQPTINSQSLIQRIQSFDDKNLEQELSNQFKNNLVLIDRIIPNKEDIIVLKRKSIFPFEQYLKEEIDSDKKISKETQTDMSSKPSDSQIKTSNVKKQKKFKKEHSKIYKTRKMEENPKQLEFSLNKQNFKQNLYQKYENSSEYQLNYLNKRLKQFDSFTESSIPLKQQKAETSDYLSPVKILENQSIIQNDDNKNLKCDTFLKELKASSSSAQSPSNNDHFKDDLNKNNKFSSSTGTNSKGEGNETILSFKNVYFQQESQENAKDIDQNKKPSIIQQNQEQQFQNNQQSNESQIQNINQNQFDIKQENNMIIKKENNNNLNDKDNKQENLENQTIDVIQKQIKGNKQQEAENTEQNNRQNTSLLDTNSNDKQFHTVNQYHIDTNTTKQNQNQTSQQKDMKNEQQLENQQAKIGQELFPQQDQFLNQNLLYQNEKQEYLSEKTSKFQNSQQQQSKDIQKNILQTSFLNNQNKQIVDKNDKSIKEQNPFLTQSPNISSDQISLYFQAFSTSNQNKQCQPQNQNQPIIDLFKISAQQPQQIMNKPQDKQNTQNLLQNANNFGNAKILQYSTNKQMEIIEQAPTQINQIIQSKQQDFESAQLNYQQQPNQQNNLFQQQQQQNYPQQLIQQQNFQLQNLFSQQQQTSNQISSLNLFQSNAFQQQQNDINNKPLFLKNDVLSLFQDTKKSDRDIFQTPLYQQTSQSLNNSFNKVKKKQRINNF